VAFLERSGGSEYSVTVLSLGAALAILWAADVEGEEGSGEAAVAARGATFTIEAAINIVKAIKSGLNFIEGCSSINFLSLGWILRYYFPTE
jgi:hypothetical protein